MRTKRDKRYDAEKENYKKNRLSEPFHAGKGGIAGLLTISSGVPALSLADGSGLLFVS